MTSTPLCQPIQLYQSFPNHLNRGYANFQPYICSSSNPALPPRTRRNSLTTANIAAASSQEAERQALAQEQVKKEQYSRTCDHVADRDARQVMADATRI